MTYQEEIINRLMGTYESAVISHQVVPSLLTSQQLAKAKHELIVFLKEGK